MAKPQFRGRFNTPESAQRFADTFAGGTVKPENGKWAVYTDREKPAPIIRANKAVFERKPTKPVQPKPEREPLPKIMLGEVANAETPTKTAFPKGRAENQI